MPKVPASWEPYWHRPDATFHLSNFADEVLGHDAGVIFFEGSGAARLKSAMPDKDGDTTDLIVSVARPPLFPFDFHGQPKAQSFSQFATQRMEAAFREADQITPWLKHTYSHAMAPMAGFIEGHRTAFDGTNTGTGAWGVMSGFLAVTIIAAEGITLAPALGVAALAGSAFCCCRRTVRCSASK